MNALILVALTALALALTKVADMAYRAWPYDYTGGLDILAGAAWAAVIVAFVVVIGGE